MMFKNIAVYLLLFFFFGCQTVQPKKDDPVTEAVSALGVVTEGLTNQGVSQKDLKNLAVQVQKDPKTRSVVQSIHQALGAQQTGVKYCPKDGQRFDVSVSICPVHQVELKPVDSE